jgi:hypothetical protein
MEETRKRRPCKRWKYEVNEDFNKIRKKNKQAMARDRRDGGIFYWNGRAKKGCGRLRGRGGKGTEEGEEEEEGEDEEKRKNRIRYPKNDA